LKDPQQRQHCGLAAMEKSAKELLVLKLSMVQSLSESTTRGMLVTNLEIPTKARLGISQQF
jgi:hypothetical protein